MIRTALVVLIAFLLVAPVAAQDETRAAATSRSDPLQIGERGRFGGLVIGVDEVVDVLDDSGAVIDLAGLTLAEPIRDDERMIAVKLYVELVDASVEDEPFNVRNNGPLFQVVGRGSNNVVPEGNACAGITTDEFVGSAVVPKIYEGGSVVATLCFVVPTEDVSTLVLSASSYFDDSPPLWLSLVPEDNGTPIATPAP